MKIQAVCSDSAKMIGATLVFLFPEVREVWGSSPVSREIWALFDFILAIGVVTGIVVMGSLFYVVLRFRERTRETVAN